MIGVVRLRLLRRALRFDLRACSVCRLAVGDVCFGHEAVGVMDKDEGDGPSRDGRVVGDLCGIYEALGIGDEDAGSFPTSLRPHDSDVFHRCNSYAKSMKHRMRVAEGRDDELVDFSSLAGVVIVSV